ncbi:DUF1566 domain-containing protein [Leptospira kobayashii]|nr:DUF1566 domain-containing protein [Leptospira kobayashii]
MVLLTILFCKPSMDDECDPFGEKNKSTILLRTLLGDNSVFCGKASSSLSNKVIVAATQFQCPSDSVPIVNGSSVSMQVTTNGTELNYSISSDLPAGLTLDKSSGKITGSYTAYKGFFKDYTITASNSLGTASCTFTPKFMGKLPFTTNITSCWDSSGTSDPTCTSPVGQDGSLRIGTTRDFTGPTLVGSDTITKDNITGLTWTSCNMGQSDINCLTGSANTYTLSTAQAACSSLDSANSGAGYANLKGWRVPEREEYPHIINLAVSNPPVFSAYFPQTISYNYKTNTIPPNSPGNTWYPTLIEGAYGAGSFTDGHYLRCVTNTFDSTKRLLDNQNGTVTDLNTSLVWQKCSVGFSNVTNCTGGSATPSNWLTAMNTCNSLSLAGRTWRLPNARELESLVDFYRTPDPATVNPTYFPNTSTGNYYWTSSTTVTAPTNAWFVGFGAGEHSYMLKSTNTLFTRCVSSF